MMTVQKHKYALYGPRRALDDVTLVGVRLLTAAVSAAELELMTRRVWMRQNIWPELEVIDVEEGETALESDTREVVSAVIGAGVLEYIEPGPHAPPHTRSRPPPATLPPAKRARCEQEGATTADVVLNVNDDSSEEGALPDLGAYVTAGVQVSDRTVQPLSEDELISDSDLIDQTTEPNPALELEDPDYWDVVCGAGELEAPGGLAMGCPSVDVWARRRWLWSRYDDGVQMDSSAWYEITPEPYALRVAENIARCLPTYERGASETDDAEPEPGAVTEPKGVIQRAPAVLAACSGVGGDAVALARVLPGATRIVCVDVDETKTQMLRRNARVYDVAERLEVVTADISGYAASICSKQISIKTLKHSVTAPMILKGETIHRVQYATERPSVVRPFDWAIVSPPWGGPEYRKCYSYFLSDQTFADLIKMVQACMTVADNICLILPRNQDVGELIHLCAHGAPDYDRFNYLSVHRMTDRDDGYAFLTAAYLSRKSPLPRLLKLTAETLSAALEKEVAMKTARLRWINNSLLRKIEGRMVAERPQPPPNLRIDPQHILKRLEAADKMPVENCVYVKFLLQYLSEPVSQIGPTQYAMSIMDVGLSLNVIGETMRVWRAGGLDKACEEGKSTPGKRTKGGVFFKVIQAWAPEVTKELRKWRRKFVELVNKDGKYPPGLRPDLKSAPLSSADISDLSAIDPSVPIEQVVVSSDQAD